MSAWRETKGSLKSTASQNGLTSRTENNVCQVHMKFKGEGYFSVKAIKCRAVSLHM